MRINTVCFCLSAHLYSSFWCRCICTYVVFPCGKMGQSVGVGVHVFGGGCGVCGRWGHRALLRVLAACHLQASWQRAASLGFQAGVRDPLVLISLPCYGGQSCFSNSTRPLIACCAQPCVFLNLIRGLVEMQLCVWGGFARSFSFFLLEFPDSEVVFTVLGAMDLEFYGFIHLH